MVVIVPTDQEGLTIFPTHRLADTADRPNPTHEDINDAVLALDAEPADKARALLVRRAGITMLYGKDGQLDPELAPSAGVRYTPDLDEALAAVASGSVEAAYVLRPTRIEDVWAVARRGDVMPQKSTFFYPKLTSGLLFFPLD
jgi:hypothetical protein